MTLPDLAVLPGTLITEPKPAVQPGRFIARVRTPGIPLAFIFLNERLTYPALLGAATTIAGIIVLHL